jgi:hypothetical protein
MTDYEKKYNAFLIDDSMRKSFATYTVGVEMPSSQESIQIETVVIEGEKIIVVETEGANVKLG